MTRRVAWYHSLRLRIALVVALVAAISVLVVGVVVDHQAGIDARERLRTQALQELRAAATLYAVDGRLRFGASVDPSLPPAPLRDATGRSGTSSYYDGHTMWAAARVTPQVLMSVAVDGTAVRQERDQLRSTVLLAGALAMALAACLGWLAATRLSLRLRRAADAVTRADGSPAAQPGQDEVSALTLAVDSATTRLAARLQAEQDFTADVAHELRTPTTALVSASELLPDSAETTLVRRQVQRLRSLVDDLLEVSRLESGDEPVDLAVVECADLVTDRVHTVRASVSVLAERRRVERILANLLSNADRYAGGHVLIVDGADVVVEDDGPGFPAELLAHGPRRFSGAGTGLGLTIAERQAAVMGARLSLANRPEGGARATLHLVPAHDAEA